MGTLYWEEYPREMWISYFQESDEDKLKFFIIRSACQYFLLIQRIRNQKILCTMHPEPQETLSACKEQAETYVSRLLERK